MSAPHDGRRASAPAYAKNTWRYLRLAMVAVVVGLGLVLEEHQPRARLHGPVPASRAPELDHARVAVAIGVVDVEQPRARVVGRERHRQQPVLAPGDDAAADVQEPLADAGVDQLDLAALLNHE